MSTRTPKSENIVWHANAVSRADREERLGQRGRLVWLTGLSGSGKSTIAVALETKLNDLGRTAYLLDGDNVRHGLCDDLGFSPDDRRENLRRVGEVGRLFVDAGIVTLASFIAPYRAERQRVRARMAVGDFIEVHVSTPLEVCEARDPKGLYRKARSGEIGSFTGVSAPYEEPENPELRIDASEVPVDQAVDAILELLRNDWA
jgi:adenylylsulfate kinase